MLLHVKRNTKVWSVCRLLADDLYLHLFPQRGECGRSLPGGSEEDLPEHPRWQSGPECCRVGSPAQTVCTSGRPPQRRQPAGQRRLQLLTRDRNYKPIGRTDGHGSSSPGSTRSADPSHQTGFKWIIFHISVLTRPKHRLTAPHRSSVLQSNIHQLWFNHDSNSSRISQLSGPLCLDQDHPRPKLDHCPD